MNKRNMRRLPPILVTAQTAKNLQRLADMCGYREIGRVVDKLTREKIPCRTLKKQPAESGRMQCGMLELRVGAELKGRRNGKQTG